MNSPEPQIPLSQIAKEFGDGSLPKFASTSVLRHYVREHGLYPRDGQIAEVEGASLSQVLRLQTLQQIEDKINRLVNEMQQTKRQHESALSRAIEIANTSTDPYELHYMAHMFMHEKTVLRAVAKNPNLSEKTQFMIASLRDFRKDRQLQLNLAHNPALSSKVMERMLSIEDVFVLQGLAHNAVRKSKDLGDPGCAEICKKIALVQWDDTLCKAAIPGVRDPEVLRYIADTNSAIFAAGKLEMVAQNIHTPTDVLEKLSKSMFAMVQHEFGMDYVTQARHTLALKRQREMAATHDDHGPSL